MIDITLVLYNSSRFLPKLVESLVQPGALPNGTALLVYDNASTDGCADLLESLFAPHRAKFHDVRIIKGTENLGFGRGHNAAAKEGAAEFIFLLNHDAELTKDCLPLLYAAACADNTKTAAWEARQSPYEHPKIYNPVTLETSWVSGACVMLRRSAFEEIGGFDPVFFMYGEDVDLSWRLRDKGFTLRYIPAAVMIHHTYTKANEVKPMQFIGSIRANLALRTRFGSYRDIGVGLARQASLLRGSRKQIPEQRKIVMKGIARWLQRFGYWRKGSTRKVAHTFYGWEYEAMRIGAFHDVSGGVEFPSSRLRGEAGGGNIPLADSPTLPSPASRGGIKISILIRTMGRSGLLKDALACLANQTYSNIEAVIVQDGADTLTEFLKPWREKLSITYEAFGQNRGRCHAGNRAMELAKGEYFMFLDEDDLFYADHIEQLLAAVLSKNAKAAMSYSFELPTEYLKDPKGGVAREGTMFSRFREPFSFPRLLRHNYIPIHTVLFHRSYFEACGGLDPNIEFNEDWNLWVRYAIHARPFVTVPKTTAIYRVPIDNEADGKRHSIMVEHQERVRKLQENLPITLTVGEFVGLVEAAPREAFGLQEQLIARFPRFRGPIVLLAKFSRMW